MYFPYFITYMALGFAISLVVFFWALKNGQFKDQKRARARTICCKDLDFSSV
ncbi:MAG: cbb3-type cytochrome oxidase assembly protein CcoS [Deltaproteobacteria bacterium]|nr:cbb3-type cytochrome oxidase assembly protein CcoS [Deltaproteobacteria bacterium]